MSDIFDPIPIENKYTSGVYYKRDVAIVRGKGTKVWDSHGKEYIDCVAGQGVANLGHCHPRVVSAINEQSQKLLTCTEIFFNDTRARLLEKLAGVLPSGLNKVYLCNSGAESVEAAIKFARLATGKKEIIATMRGFHGRTMGALSATWEKRYRQPFFPLIPEVQHVPYDKIEKITTAISENTAAVLVEVVQGEGGVRPGSREYLSHLRQLCDEKGCLLIFDEVQTGFGRTGQWFACQHHGISPDILTMGKAIAGGVPMGAVAMGERVVNLKPGTHGSTFGGNPLACAASLAALGAYEDENLIRRSLELGEYAREKIKNINHRFIREVRGLGLMIGIELKTKATPYLRALMQHGVLALPAGPTVLRLLPPLIISKEELDQVVSVIEKVLNEEKNGG
ncbi:aspartate aminotransferase family protein [Candidatus Uabimicrobium amorphum]|uniref:Acetylornithine aminotransferase n=1 Tax=Uabimicrobium amorphum TaxID=2596890 RepID=A0A5S9IMU2_UABAM|nr:acetylornithine/succinylornithine family transaminase [Candidatus Uabimicrobium amorphum]BBM83940.1 acetylornithine aminotransferase [Candidatus Uabimicrobium amorphum]